MSNNDPLNPYPNLDREGLTYRMEIDDLAERIIEQNYGLIRMCAALCRAAHRLKRSDNSPLVNAIETAIKNGAYSEKGSAPCEKSS